MVRSSALPLIFLGTRDGQGVRPTNLFLERFLGAVTATRQKKETGRGAPSDGFLYPTGVKRHECDTQS